MINNTFYEFLDNFNQYYFDNILNYSKNIDVMDIHIYID